MSKNYETFKDGSRKPKVTIVGCGLAGISAAVALKNDLGFENFVIYERSDAIGGTWRDNTYPGCGSDIPCHWYSLSTELNPNWKSYYASQPEIRQYWEGIFNKHKLQNYLEASTNVEYARWDNERQGYELTLSNTRTGEKTTVFTELLIWAIGGFMAPAFPKDLLGTQDFKGHLWHSARWNHDVPLKGKRVGVIGNGCSSAQIVPEISKDPTVHVTNFCRTPQWYMKRPQFNYPGFVKSIFRNVPFVLRWYRNVMMARSDMGYVAFTKQSRWFLTVFRWAMERYIKMNAPKEFHAQLIPEYPPGCRRIIVDPGYLQCLSQPNVELCWENIDRIVENGILLKDGKVIELDVVVLGTGFELLNTDFKMTGSDGRTLEAYFKSKDGPSAYLGTSVPGFPNFSMLLGPNVSTGHASIIFAEEVQINYSLKLMKPVIDGLAKSFEVKDEVSDKYNDYLQDRHKSSVQQDCRSFYRSESGRNFATFPGTMTLFYWLARKVRWENYKAVGADKWEAKRKSQERKRKLNVSLTLLLTVAFAVGLYTGSFKQPALRLRELIPV